MSQDHLSDLRFDTLPLHEQVQNGIRDAGFEFCTPIQASALPIALEQRDVAGQAQTGTGKTAAFLIAAYQKLIADPVEFDGPHQPRVFALAPTRELAKQIADNIGTYVRGTHLKVGLVVGGASINAQVNLLQRGTDLLVATPGRLIDLLERKAVRLDAARYLVLDEADQMLDMGFIHALRRIAPLLPKERQTMLFSATMPKLMADLSKAYLNDPIRIEVSPPGKPADKVSQALHFVEQAGKTELLVEHLDAHREDLALVFTRTKYASPGA